MLNRRHGAFDNPAGLALLERATASLHSPASKEARAVHSLRRVRGYCTLRDDIAAVAVQLKQLQAALPTIPGHEQATQAEGN